MMVRKNGHFILVSLLLAVTVGSSHVGAQCFSENDREDGNSTSSNVHVLLKGFMDFGINVYKNLATDSLGNASSNIFFSPISIWSALTATYVGSNGTTQAELSRTLGLDSLAKNSVANAYRVLRYWYFLRASDTLANYTFKMANKLFFDEKEQVRECIARYFSTEIKKLNFGGEPEKSRQLINRWIAEQTNDKIRDMLPVGFVDKTTRLILVNAAYFKGDWEKKFKPERTEKGDFWVTPSKKVEALMMHQNLQARFKASDELDATSVELTYSGGDLSFLIVLPNEKSNVDELTRRLTPQTLMNLIRSMPFRDVDLTLPKFSIEQTIELRGILSQLGIQELFNPFLADLSGFTGSKDLSVSNVHHKSFVEVNEEGSEAAAATAILTFRTGGSKPQFELNANRPFLFIIRDSVLDTILFMGVLKNPASS